jgi:hypothetical protein
VPDHAISKEDIAEFEKILKAAGANTAAFEYVRRSVRNIAQYDEVVFML